MKNKAILFDLDGTLVDSYNAHFHSFQEVMKTEYDLLMTRDDFRLLFGRPAPEIARVFLEMHEVQPGDIPSLVEEKRTLFRKKYVEEVDYFQGVEELLKDLIASDFTLAIASNSVRLDIEAMMQVTGLDKYMNSYIGIDEVLHGKPDPALFIRCTQRLDIEKENSIGVDDSLSGIKASIDAGLKTIAVLTGGAEKEEVSQLNPDLIATSLKDLAVSDFLGLL